MEAAPQDHDDQSNDLETADVTNSPRRYHTPCMDNSESPCIMNMKAYKLVFI